MPLLSDFQVGVSSVTHHPEWSPPCSPKHTRIQTTAMTHHSNNSVRDHMKWVSGSLHLQNHHHGFNVSRCHFISLSPHWFSLTPCLSEESYDCHFLLWHVVCVSRLGCWAVRRCCPAWPWCKPTASQARRRWCHPWVTGTEPVLRVSKATRSTATMDTKFTMDNHTIVTWGILQLGVVHLWLGRFLHGDKNRHLHL